jgi:hypothetical protein
MRERVVDELQRIERQYGVRVLLAGSKDELDGLLRRWVVTHDAPPCPQPGR